MEDLPNLGAKKREIAPLAERLQLGREVFIKRYEDLLRDPNYQARSEELANIEELKNNKKIKPYRIIVDMAAFVSKTGGVDIFTLKELAAFYDELFTPDWRSSLGVNYDQEEWGDA